MSKYTKELKLAVVKDYESLNISYTKLSKKYDVQPSLLKRWIYGYRCHGSSYFDKRTHIYTTEFKLSVLQYIKNHCISPIRAAALFNIPSFTTVMQWQKLYNTGEITALGGQPRGRPKMTKPTSNVDKNSNAMTAEELLEEVLNLRAERDYLKKLQALIQEKQSAAKTRPH